MKNDRKTVDNRQLHIFNYIKERNGASVEELSEIFGVSSMTVRRDLEELSRKGRIRRLHGRAVPAAEPDSYAVTDLSTMHARKAISAFAATLVDDGDEIFINGSRTALFLLQELGDKHVTVRTNNGYALDHAWPEGVKIHLTGGELFGKIMVGEYVVQSLLTVSADKTFLGCAAVYDDGEFRYDIPTEISINEMMISRTRGELYVLADHGKLKKRAGSANSYGSFRYNYPVTLVTDSRADSEILQKLRELDIKVIQVPVEGKLI